MALDLPSPKDRDSIIWMQPLRMVLYLSASFGTPWENSLHKTLEWAQAVMGECGPYGILDLERRATQCFICSVCPTCENWSSPKLGEGEGWRGWNASSSPVDWLLFKCHSQNIHILIPGFILQIILVLKLANVFLLFNYLQENYIAMLLFRNPIKCMHLIYCGLSVTLQTF